jgi:hypothetical protein
MAEPSAAASTKCTPQLGFGAISGITLSTCDKFLQAFQSSMTGSPPSITNDFLAGFLLSADSFSSQCCEKFAAMLRQSSTQPEVRETTEPILTRLIRNRCFEALDSTLLDYTRIVEQSGISLKPKLGQLADSRLRDAARDTAGLMGGPDGPQKTLLPQEGKAAALVKILEYLRGLDNLPHELLDYGAIKLFGGDVDYLQQNGFLQNMRDGIHERLNACISTVESLDLVKQKLWEEQRAAETAAIKAAVMSSVQSSSTKKGALGAFAFGVLCTGPVWFAATTGAHNTYVVGGAVVSGVAAIVFVFVGIARLTRA